MGYRITVIIPRSYLTVEVNVFTQKELEQFEESVASSFSKRWQIDEFLLEIRDDVDEPQVVCDGGDLIKPFDAEFFKALEEAIKHFRFFRAGTITAETGKGWDSGPVLTPPVPYWGSGPDGPPGTEGSDSTGDGGDGGE